MITPAGEAGAALRWMFWTSGRDILRAAERVRRQPNLFGVYVTNFSCGPDSFLTGYFRDLMGEKPSLMLELDAHTADAGIDTRIEAFLDVVAGYRQLAREERVAVTSPG
jgi:predicted nucleotide-binding protein (sugar kinase/HSP70/actin superfamily)